MIIVSHASYSILAVIDIARAICGSKCVERVLVPRSTHTVTAPEYLLRKVIALHQIKLKIHTYEVYLGAQININVM